ncbi:6-phosphogluconate dehydrogenase/gluconokinase [Pustulibacterium marinum]|uniref:Gluconokinase n=1 Tax=Pustulibacterium marinum TaxID=1224947 RepID=A0A1I7IPV3_9FLAO|nr:gluconokinase [Pustulibacterium marinum]SFU74931.1 6-phosphogluconate dehydrogenase/gluconokinase [Pustulibacterium marinum]
MIHPTIYIVMGVSASGKTTIAKKLSEQLKIKYIEADDYHSDANKEKMSNGIPLNDEDRLPWLEALHQVALEHIQDKTSAVMTCSALKEKYRKILTESIEENVQFIFLKGSYELIYDRIAYRKNHFMVASLLKSQFDTLEEPNNAIVVDVSGSIEENMNELMQQLT